ncbi:MULTISPECIES: winged helix-turn-helix transcriptional regulator [Pseudomonas]|jgi:DNA-binding HxlR family transcriptional regulator|uniref:Transcriptional regulator n=1 Tax=Pseudomonas lactis TaxID=1615674 RepID=I4K5A7_9PSED|nr:MULTISPECIES: helix-turn-helix domain-containing protein [Pseudomonas]TKJ97394.1 transcriptional regulator [Pseudomonas fluorescens]EIK59897.1 transcriptional regulator, HxlR family [Pseudomonas lactis]KRP83827.1 HxlR family transcriptional regulator [Pseudomonas lactis]MBI6978909.1 helix-turn-helix transcriptional regulator [Pseudomonas lactis]MCF4974957.1 transcriptional regulator [Pseudomonas lactis]
MNSEREWDCGDPKNRVKWAEATMETLRVLEGKWKIIILCQLFAAKGPLRFSDLEKLIEGINQKMLIQQLKQLEKDAIVRRTVYPQVPPKVEYELTEDGYALGPSMQALIEWAEQRRSPFDEA